MTTIPQHISEGTRERRWSGRYCYLRGTTLARHGSLLRGCFAVARPTRPQDSVSESFMYYASLQKA